MAIIDILVNDNGASKALDKIAASAEGAANNVDKTISSVNDLQKATGKDININTQVTGDFSDPASFVDSIKSAVNEIAHTKVKISADIKTIEDYREEVQKLVSQFKEFQKLNDKVQNSKQSESSVNMNDVSGKLRKDGHNLYRKNPKVFNEIYESEFPKSKSTGGFIGDSTSGFLSSGISESEKKFLNELNLILKDYPGQPFSSRSNESEHIATYVKVQKMLDNSPEHKQDKNTANQAQPTNTNNTNKDSVKTEKESLKTEEEIKKTINEINDYVKGDKKKNIPDDMLESIIKGLKGVPNAETIMGMDQNDRNAWIRFLGNSGNLIHALDGANREEIKNRELDIERDKLSFRQLKAITSTGTLGNGNKTINLKDELASVYMGGMGFGEMNPSLIGGRLFGAGMRFLKSSMEKKEIEKIMAENSDTYREWKNNNKNKKFFKDAGADIQAKASGEITDLLKNSPKLMNNISKAGRSMVTALGLGTTAIIKFGEQAIQFAKDSVNAFQEMESLQTQLSVVYGSDTQSREAFNSIEAFAKKSPFGIETMTQQAILLKQSGVGSSELMNTMAQIGDLASGNAEKMKSISDVYARILSSTTVTAKDMRQLSIAGIPSYEYLSKATKINGDNEGNGYGKGEIRSALQAGKITSADFKTMVDLLTGPGGTFNGAVERGAKTLKARQQNLSDMKQMAQAAVGELIVKYGGTDINDSFFGAFLNIQEKIWTKVESIAKDSNTLAEYTVSKNGQEGLSTLASVSDPILKEIFERASSLNDPTKRKEYQEKQFAAGYEIYQKSQNELSRTLSVVEDKQLKLYKAMLTDIRNNNLGSDKKLSLDVAEGAWNITDQYKNESFYEDVMKLTNAEVKATLTELNKMIKSGEFGTTAKNEKENKEKLDLHSIEYLNATLEKSQAQAHDDAQAIVDSIGDSAKQVGAVSKRADWKREWDAGQIQTVHTGDKKWRDDIAFGQKILAEGRQTQVLDEKGNVTGYDMGKSGSFEKFIEIQTDLLSEFRSLNLSLPTMFNLDTKEQLEGTKEELDIYKDNFEQWFNTLIKDEEWSSYLDNTQGVFLLTELGKMRTILKDTSNINSDTYTAFLGMKNNLPNLLKNTLGMGKALTPAQLKMFREAEKAFQNTDLEMIYSTKDAELAGARPTPPLWAQILGNATGIDSVRAMDLKGEKAMNDFYKNNIAQRNLFKTVAGSLLANGESLGKIQEKLVRTTKNYQGTQNFDWIKSMRDIEEMASRKSIATQQSLIQGYQDIIDTINDLETAGVATLDQWNDLHDASQILGSGFHLAAQKMADGSYKFTEATIQTAEEMKKAYNAKIIKEQIELTFRQAIDTIQKDTLKTQVKMGILSGEYNVGAYVRNDEADTMTDVIMGVFDDVEKMGGAGLFDAINASEESFRTSMLTDLNKIAEKLYGRKVLKEETTEPASRDKIEKTYNLDTSDPVVRMFQEAISESWLGSAATTRIENLGIESIKQNIKYKIRASSGSEQDSIRSAFMDGSGNWIGTDDEIRSKAVSFGIPTTITKEVPGNRTLDANRVVEKLWTKLKAEGYTTLNKDDFWNKYMSPSSSSRMFSFNSDGTINFSGKKVASSSTSKKVVKASGDISDDVLKDMFLHINDLPSDMANILLNAITKITGKDGSTLSDVYDAQSENTAALKNLDYLVELKNVAEHLDDWTQKRYKDSLSNVSPWSPNYNPYQLKSTKAILSNLGIDENHDFYKAFDEVSGKMYENLKKSREKEGVTNEDIYKENKPLFDMLKAYGGVNEQNKYFDNYVGKVQQEVWTKAYGQIGKEMYPEVFTRELALGLDKVLDGVLEYGSAAGNAIYGSAGYLGMAFANQDELDDVKKLLVKGEDGAYTRESIDLAKEYYVNKYRMPEYYEQAKELMSMPEDTDISKLPQALQNLYQFIKPLMEFDENGVITEESQDSIYQAIMSSFADSEFNNDIKKKAFDMGLENAAFSDYSFGEIGKHVDLGNLNMMAAGQHFRDSIMIPVDETNTFMDKELNGRFEEIQDLLASGNSNDMVKALEKMEELEGTESFKQLFGDDAENFTENFLSGLYEISAVSESINKTWEGFGAEAFDAITNMPLAMFSDFTTKLGEEWYQMAAHGKEWADSAEDIHKSMVKIVSDTMSNVSGAAINAGLNIAGQAALVNNWGMVAAGLGLAAAGGFGNIFSSYMSSWANDSNSADDAVERLERLKNSLADLLEQARNDATYYEVTLRNKSALASNDYISAQSVNDMIITPQGNFSTAPDDYIMAMKDPKSLQGTGGASFSPKINFSVVNESGQVLGVTSTSKSMSEDGDLDIIATVNAVVANSIANGEYDNAFDTMKARKKGNFVSA